ncbi:TPA: hypothetical protein DDY47_02305 [candidate division WWE3 bacterium]|uniref:Uncharacterized protein n=3 Tax=Katanobacteria TaxID=422282 RepID=A0A354G405_UNCKA|nr:hypothetical protein [candidate division WWE3 bacterium]
MSEFDKRFPFDEVVVQKLGKQNCAVLTAGKRKPTYNEFLFFCGLSSNIGRFHIMYNNRYMCLAIPGIVKEIQGGKLIIEYPTETRQALAGGMPLKVGDYVLVQMGIAIKVVTKKEAEVSWKAWKSTDSKNSN